MTYKVAIVGGGNMGSTHARHWQALPDVDLAAVLDPHRDEIKITGKPHYKDWTTMLAEVKPDIIDICTPTSHHREYVDMAAAAGKAIFCEKPLSRTMEDCDEIVDIVEKSGVPFQGGHVLRFFPEFAFGKRLLDAGSVGKPATVRTARMSGFPGRGRANNWYGDYKQSGGVILDLILHDFDWLRWCFGDVERVYAKGLETSEKYRGKLDYALVTLRFKSGVVGHVTGSWAHPAGFRTTYEIAGDSGIIDHDSARSAALTYTQRAQEGEDQTGKVAVSRSPMAASDDPYLGELTAFIAALKAGVTPPVTVYDAREAVRIALAAVESVETGKAVNL